MKYRHASHHCLLYCVISFDMPCIFTCVTVYMHAFIGVEQLGSMIVLLCLCTWSTFIVPGYMPPTEKKQNILINIRTSCGTCYTVDIIMHNNMVSLPCVFCLCCSQRHTTRIFMILFEDLSGWSLTDLENGNQIIDGFLLCFYSIGNNVEIMVIYFFIMLSYLKLM